MTTFIYALLDPTTSECRYVGKTNNLVRRLSQHVFDTRASKKCAWINDLRSRGFRPEIVVLEECCAEVWVDSEQFWVAMFKSLGARLVNSTAGGDGAVDLEGMERHRAAINTPEYKLKHATGLRRAWAAPGERDKRGAAISAGKMRNPDTRKKHGEFIRSLHADAEYQEKHRAAIIAAVTKPEYKAKISAASKRNWEDPEYRNAQVAERRARVGTVKGSEQLAKARANRLSTPEARQRNSNKMKQNWATPEYRDKVMAAREAAKRNSNPLTER